jgi:hypothetical protein
MGWLYVYLGVFAAILAGFYKLRMMKLAEEPDDPKDGSPDWKFYLALTVVAALWPLILFLLFITLFLDC